MAMGEGKKRVLGARGWRAGSITLKINVLEVDGAAVAAVEEPGAYEVGQTGAGVVLALPEERDLRRDMGETRASGLCRNQKIIKRDQSPEKISGSSQRFNRDMPEINF